MNKLLQIITLSFIILITSCISKQDKSESNDNVRNENSTSIVGKWKMENTPIGDNILYIFNDDGTCSITSTDIKSNNNLSNLKWSRNEDKIYISLQGRKKVVIMQILSLDNKSLVIWEIGEPKDDITYLTRF